MSNVRQELTPLQGNSSDGLIKSIGTRLYIDKFAEHREAAEYLQQQDIYGEGTCTLVLALISYRDTVVKPLERLPRSTKFEDLPEELRAERTAFSVIPEGDRERPARVRNVSVRLYVDRWVEHKEAHAFLQKQQKLYGSGGKTMVRALLHFKRLHDEA